MDNKGANVIVSGYPKMDTFFNTSDTSIDSRWKQSGQGGLRVKRLIWAPHWTISKSGLLASYSTFPEYYKKLLEYVEHQNIEVILKPLLV